MAQKSEKTILSIAIIPLAFEDLSRGEADRANISAFLTDALHDEATEKIKSARIIPSGVVYEEYNKVVKEKPSLSYKQAAMETCRRVGSQAAIIGNIVTFREREGGPMGVSAPAAVTFDLHLVDCSNGSLLWEDYFNETQQSLLENLLEIKKFLERQGKWITARELALEGVRRVIDDLNRYLES
ncbi:MAG: hypothetical protein QXI19_07065 [Candidatus Caldarchaeum sp.]